MSKSNYHLEIHEDVLVLKTATPRAERRSVLHSGIFNRELASSLASGALVTVLGFFAAGRGAITAAHRILALVLFTISFLVFRRYVFREQSFETVFRMAEGTIETTIGKKMGRRKEILSISELSEIRLDHEAVQLGNLDGIEVVAKVALQHGMVIPGFGRAEDVYTVMLDFSGRTLPVFSTGERKVAETLISQVRLFLREGRREGIGSAVQS
ncbi:MAG TPA: hypothetical protein VEI96_06090 [Thermodesulfovibrionales bacterium]|nr:hypothetical protein [Thermodesulfovibrionales bacterium]